MTFSFEAQVNRLHEAASCALNQLYGGMPGVGGFEDFTEYEIGAGLIAEAAHCILGSCGKVFRWTEQGNPSSGWKVERGHFKEESGIIQHTLKEYSQSLYTDRVFKGERAIQSIESMKNNCPKLRVQAEKNKAFLRKDRSNYDPMLYEIAVWAYNTIRDLADAVYSTVKDATNKPTGNAFRDIDLRASANVLDRNIKIAYAKNEDVHISQVTVPRYEVDVSADSSEELKAVVRAIKSSSRVGRVFSSFGTVTVEVNSREARNKKEAVQFVSKLLRLAGLEAALEIA